MGTTYEQFIACLRNPTARRLIGLTATDEEAATLLADPDASRAYFEIWSSSRETAPPSPAPAPVPAPVPPAAAPPEPERTLLDVWTFGKGSSRVHVLLTTAKLEISGGAGTSIWKSFLGAATLGASLALTGITVKAGGELVIPIRLVDAAFVAAGGAVYSTLKVVVKGEAAEFSIMTLAVGTIAAAINAAVAGGADADFHARVWATHSAGQGRTWPSDRDLRRMLRAGKLTQPQFEREAAIGKHLRALASI